MALLSISDVVCIHWEQLWEMGLIKMCKLKLLVNWFHFIQLKFHTGSGSIEKCVSHLGSTISYLKRCKISPWHVAFLAIKCKISVVHYPGSTETLHSAWICISYVYSWIKILSNWLCSKAIHKHLCDLIHDSESLWHKHINELGGKVSGFLYTVYF